jgi:hypothetical protein
MTTQHDEKVRCCHRTTHSTEEPYEGCCHGHTHQEEGQPWPHEVEHSDGEAVS